MISLLFRQFSKLPLNWRQASSELLRRPLRTLLTLLGLIFGVAAIVAMQAVGEGSRREAERIVESLGLQNLVAEVKQQDESVLRESRKRTIGLSRTDARAALAVIPGADAVASEKQVRVYAVYSDFDTVDAGVSGVDPEWFRLSSLMVETGRTLNAKDSEDSASVAVIGRQVAERLFPGADPIGRFVKVNHVWLEVVGVLADRDSLPNEFEGISLSSDGNKIFIPIETAMVRFRFEPMQSEIDRMLLHLGTKDELASGARILSSLLEQRHGGVSDYRVVVPLQLLQQHQRTQRIFRIVMGVIAGVSLLVGGIGITNIMLANVLERRHEIGLLRALGGSQSDITEQFLREAAVVCFVGSLVGFFFGVALAYFIAIFADWRVAWAPVPLLLSVSLCFIIGLMFGVYPARSAANLDPIAALRRE